jgi:hypothetical protein
MGHPCVARDESRATNLDHESSRFLKIVVSGSMDKRN